MAINLSSSGYQGGAGGRFRYRPMSEINVTPFVDVMLVLLIIFMVTAPLLTVGVPVDLPKTAAKPISEPDEPLVITVNKSGKIFLQQTEVTLEALVPKLIAITHAKPDARIFIRGDKELAYGSIMQVMATTTAAGFTKVALITEMADGVTTEQRGKRQSPASKGQK